MELAARGEVARTLHPQVVALVQRFDRVYAARKLAAAALDFADLELRARDLLVSDADARAAVQARVRHLLVDEFQDTNALQDSILELVAGEDAERVYVGDERQSIYRFRDADVEVFRKRRDGAETVVRLDDCFRSSDVLVGVLNELFGNVFDDGFQRLVPRGSAPSPEDGVALELLVVDETGPIAGAREREASALAARLAALRDEGHPQSGMVVLLRASTDADLYEAALRQAGFETHRTIGGGYYGRQQVSDLCAYLRLLRSRYDDRALLTVLASPLIGVSNPGLYALRRAAQTALFRGLEYGLPDGLSEDDARLMRAFRQRFDRLVDAAQQLGIADLLERIVSEHDYDLACLAQVGRAPALRERAQAGPPRARLRGAARARSCGVPRARRHARGARLAGARGRARRGGGRRGAHPHRARGEGPRVRHRGARRRRARAAHRASRACSRLPTGGSRSRSPRRAASSSRRRSSSTCARASWRTSSPRRAGSCTSR